MLLFDQKNLNSLCEQARLFEVSVELREPAKPARRIERLESRQTGEVICSSHKNYFATFLSAHFLIGEIVNLNLTFAVYRMKA